MATIVIEREKQNVLAEIKRSEATLRDAVSRLRSIPELDVPSNLGSIVDADWLREQLGNRIALVRADKSLTAAEREQRLNPWRAIKSRAERAVLKIDGILHDWSGLSWLPDEDGKNFHLDQLQIEQVATQKATREIPPQALRHWELICKMREAVEALRNFEAEHQVKDAPLFYLARMTENQLYESWINRSMILERRVIGNKVISGQKIKQIFY